MRQTGIAQLPLHGGKAPVWLFQRMVRLGREITRLIIENDGPQAFLQRIADPYWLQSLGCVLGFDWHSSGVMIRRQRQCLQPLDFADEFFRPLMREIRQRHSPEVDRKDSAENLRT
jgi:Protein of unknown function (DUF763)